MFGRVLCLCAVLFVSSPLLHAGCDDVVWDQQGVLSVSDFASLQNQAKQLISIGANPHVLTLDVGNDSMEAAVNNVQGSCSSWRGPDGTRKDDLLVFALDTRKHKSGIYFGSLFHHALDEHWHDIATTYMNPHFHDHEWEAGLVEGIRQTHARIVASRTVSSATGTTIIQTPQQPTDYAPFLAFLKWFGIVLLLICGTWWLIWLFRNRAKRKAERNDAYNAANDAKSSASHDLDDAKRRMREDEASGTIWSTSRKQSVDQLFIDFARIPEIDDPRLSTSFLIVAKDKFETLSAQAKRISMNTPVIPPREFNGIDRRSPRSKFPFTANDQRAVPRYPEPTPTHSQVPHVTIPTPPVVVNTDSGNLATGILLGDLLSNRDRDEEPVHHHHHRDDDSSSSYSPSRSSSDDGGGGGSSWSAPDPGSGGGTDFSMPDSGGGGGTDF